MSKDRRKITVEFEKFLENTNGTYLISKNGSTFPKKIVLQNYKFSIVKMEKFRENAGA